MPNKFIIYENITWIPVIIKMQLPYIKSTEFVKWEDYFYTPVP